MVTANYSVGSNDKRISSSTIVTNEDCIIASPYPPSSPIPPTESNSVNDYMKQIDDTT